LNRRKREAREAHKSSQFAQKVTGLRAKMYNKKRHSEKIQMKKTYVLFMTCRRIGYLSIWTSKFTRSNDERLEHGQH
jgi:hypothetical protein